MNDYMEKIKNIPPENIVYIDETGIDEFYYRKYARAPRGESIYGKIRGRKFERTNIVAAQAGKKIIAPLKYKGMMHSQFFEAWFEGHLIPELEQGAVVVMDNASFHRKKRLYEIAEQHKIKIIFLPPYSPELNPIEHFWHWLKKRICDLLKISQNVDEVINSIFKVF
ncbi:MAG: IS630 family transposase [Synergistaceae bacterium]|nr:IS630 family transposase [Synergistaceae bacterium]